jgi:hypothetical protein
MKQVLIITILTILLSSCAEPLSEEELKFVGLWKNNQTSLLITSSGKLEYESKKGAVTISVSMPIKKIDGNGIETGVLFFSSSFDLQGLPQKGDGMLFLVVDGEKLYKADDQGRFPKATLIPSVAEIRLLVTSDMMLFSQALNGKDFEKYLGSASLILQSQYSNEKLLDVYKPLMDKNIDLSDYMVGDLLLTEEPVINEDGALIISGTYPSPSSLKLKMGYVYSHPNWKSIGPINISINKD